MRNFRRLVLGLVLVSLAGFSWGASSGTGFFVSSQGHIVTNEHVVENCSAIDFSFGGQKHNALVLAVDKTNDIALLKTTFNNPKFLSFAPNDPELLDPIIVAGYPFGDSLSSTIKVTRGVVSSLAGIDNNFSNVQIDAAIQPGNSGGPIVNDQGQVLAIAVSKLDAEYALKTFGSLPESVNFGIKSGLVKSFLVANNVAVAQSPLADKKLGQLLTETTVKLNCASKVTKARHNEATRAAPAIEEREAYARAISWMRAKRYEESLGAFEQLIVDYPKGQYTPNAFYWLGELQLNFGELEKAIQNFSQVVRLYPSHQKMPDALYKLGVTHYQLGNEQKARQYLQKLQTSHPQSAAGVLAARYLELM